VDCGAGSCGEPARYELLMVSVQLWWPLCETHTALARTVMSDMIAEVRDVVPASMTDTLTGG
jgi:hypothetical protein